MITSSLLMITSSHLMITSSLLMITSFPLSGVREKALLAQLNREDDKIRTSIRKYNYPSKTHRFLGNEEQSGKELKKVMGV